MEYWKGILKAIIPRKFKDIIAVSLLAPTMVYMGYRLAFPQAPIVTVRQETVYPKEVVRGSYFFLAFDLQWDQTCDVSAQRYIIGSDGIEYLAQEDQKQVIKDQRMQYIVRIPIPLSIPVGPAKVRSDFSYECDWFSHWIKATNVSGRIRNINIMSEIGLTPAPDKKDLSNF